MPDDKKEGLAVADPEEEMQETESIRAVGERRGDRAPFQLRAWGSTGPDVTVAGASQLVKESMSEMPP